MASNAVRHVEKRRTSTCAFADRVARLSVDHYNCVVLDGTQPRQPTCLATIVAYFSSNDELQVLSMGVGTKFLSESVLEQEARGDSYGQRIRDCHAEVLAKRAFQRYLLEAMLKDSSSEENGDATSDDNGSCPRHGRIMILERVGDSHSLYRLDPDVTLHMYCSSAPCGNAVLKKFATLRKEQFRTDLAASEWPKERHESMPGHSIPLGQFELLIKKDNPGTRQESEAADPNDRPMKRSRNVTIKDAGVRRKEKRWPINCSTDWCPPGTTAVWANEGSIHTCSDKLCRWNCLGLQGSLLSSLLEAPMYLSTVTVGRKLSAITCRRALCCRLGKDDSDMKRADVTDADADGRRRVLLLAPYRLNHPAVMGTSVYLDEAGVIDMSSEEAGKGQDVRFHSSSSFAWWNGRGENVEYIDGTNGFLERPSNNVAPSHVAAQLKRSRISTSSLLELYVEMRVALREKDGATHVREDAHANAIPNSLTGLRAFKCLHSAAYENTKELMLSRHPVLRRWKRRQDPRTATG